MPLRRGTGGMPVGALLAKEKAAVFTLGDHNATFGGNPVTSAAAYATLKYMLDNDVAGNANRVGQYLMAGLTALQGKYPAITDVRGRGLLLAVEFDKDVAQDILMNCLDNGLLINRLKTNAIRLVPPLIIGNREVDEAIDILDNAISSVVD